MGDNDWDKEYEERRHSDEGGGSPYMGVEESIVEETQDTQI